MTWNVEGLRRNAFHLKYLSELHKPDIIFISEPQVFLSDVDLILSHLRGYYCWSLNSMDKHDPELPLAKTRAHGGTLILWKCVHDPYIVIHPVFSSSFLPILFQPPNSPLSIHVCIYLPTLGKEAQFAEELSRLSNTLEDLRNLHPDSPIYLRGDFNVSGRDKTRSGMLEYFIEYHELQQVDIKHPTYHHFTGDGARDSCLDKIIFSRNIVHPEVIDNIICKLNNPLIESLHDMILSTWTLIDAPLENNTIKNITAPKIENSRHKVAWTDLGIAAFQDLVLPHLERLQSLWLSSPTKSSMSLLLESTARVFTTCASLTNKTVSLASPPDLLARKTPRLLRQSARQLLNKSRRVKYLKNEAVDPALLEAAHDDFKTSRIAHRRLVRQIRAKEALARDSNLLTNPLQTYSKIRASRRSKAGKINKLKVGTKIYQGETVPDGFFDSITALKTRNTSSIMSSKPFLDFSVSYHHIIELCKTGAEIPQISESAAFALLQKMKPTVNDFYSVTPNHYKYAGPVGWRHFHLLINALISNVNNISISEVNTAYACILFKGHGKDKTSDRSYRTISTCPVVAKALDLLIRDRHIETWNETKALTQFQGEGSTHELAALLLTETIQHSLYAMKQPVYALYLDAKSAFDVVLRELLVKNLYNIGTCGHSLLYLDTRLKQRQTYIDWEGKLMGPIIDEQGLEQGGVSSSDFYKIFGREQLVLAQKSSLGVKLGQTLTVSAIGQADDTVLTSNNINNLFYLLQLTKNFCSKYMVELCADKTKLQVFHTKTMKLDMKYAEAINPIVINNEAIHFATSADHVGLLRSTLGNGPAILSRFTAHRKALAGVLHTGMARGHRGNPVSSLHIDKLYAIPVLLSGLATLVLTDAEIRMIDQHQKETIRCLLRLQQNTPRCVVYFLSGCLPGAALLHLRQLSIFGMISRLPGSILHQHSLNVFSSKTISPKSWFHQIRRWCMLYGLPHPLDFLKSPPTKATFKTFVKKRVIDYWESLLRAEATLLPSLSSFRPAFMSLTTPHPIWTTAGSSPASVAMATVQSVMLSGRYYTEALCSHWSKNKRGLCLLSPVECIDTIEDLNHIIKICPVLTPCRQNLVLFTEKYADKIESTEIRALLTNLCDLTHPSFVNFLLDCSSLPEVIASVQQHGQAVLHHLFRVTRTWLFVLHRERLKILGRWNNFC